MGRIYRKIDREKRALLKTLYKEGAPEDMIRRFEMLTRPFFKHMYGYWPLQHRSRCDAFFAAAALSKLTGGPVERIIFVTSCAREPRRDLWLFLERRFLWGIVGQADRGRLRRLIKLLKCHSCTLPNNFRCVEDETSAILTYLAYAVALGDREMFGAIESIAIMIEDMIPLEEADGRPGVWHVLAG